MGYSFDLSPFNSNVEPNQNNIRQYLDNLYTKFQPIEQARWNQSNIDTLFYAGAQNFVNAQFNYTPNNSWNSYYFNLIQQPVNMITGYQRQHRKTILHQAREGSDAKTTDQYTKLASYNFNEEGLSDKFSKACELATVSGMVLAQPYLDYTGDDPAQGQMRLKIWEYNSFLVDPFFRNPDMSDAQFVWCQEYISHREAQERFPERANEIRPMSGSPQTFGRFYFLPENHNMERNNLMVVSYVWYKATRRKKRLYSPKLNQFFDYAGGDGQLEAILYAIDDMQPVTVNCPTWKLCTVLNDRVMYNGENPLGFDRCPFVPMFWNYDPHINQYDLRVRSLVRCMRDPQFLFNYKVITNNDIAAATINSGWKRKQGAVANEDNLKKSQAGWDIIINDGYEMTDAEKIIPTAVPESDLALADQMASLIQNVSGINMENWAGQDDKQISALTSLLKQAANLLVFQKYFDQWDYSLKQIGELCLDIELNNWNAAKVGLMIGEEPTPHFFSRIFAKYKTVVEEGLITPTQRNLQAQQMMEINSSFGREVIPPSMIIKDMNIQGKTEILEFLQQQEQQASQMQQEQMNVQHAFEHAKLQELMTKATLNIASARERHGRSESDIGLYEERLSNIEKNRSMSLKQKQEATTSLLENIQKFGEIEQSYAENKLKIESQEIRAFEEQEKQDVERRVQSNKFLEEIMRGVQQQNPVQNNNEM